MNKINYFFDKTLIEENAMKVLSKFEKSEFVEKIAVFPDIHWCDEKSLPIGVAFETSEVFYPLITGKDVGCGVGFIQIPKNQILKPFNKNQHYRAFDKESYSMTDEGLGGGNHFLSIEEDETNWYVICHTGTRNLGISLYQKHVEMIQNFNYENSLNVDYLPISYLTDSYLSEYSKILEYGFNRRKLFCEKTIEFLKRNKYVNQNFENFQFHDSCHNHLDFQKLSDGTFKIIHRKGSTELNGNNPVVIPLSMTRGSLIVKANIWTAIKNEKSLNSCSHGAGRKLSRTDTLKHWHSLKKSQKDQYKKDFPELLDKSRNFSNGYLQEFDFAYKNSNSILKNQPHLIKITETKPIVTVKFTEI